jgi:hypothetical protein
MTASDGGGVNVTHEADKERLRVAISRWPWIRALQEESEQMLRENHFGERIREALQSS